MPARWCNTDFANLDVSRLQLFGTYLNVLQGSEWLRTEVIQQLNNGWLEGPCQELLAYMQKVCFLVISTSTPTDYLLQLCERQDVTFGQLLGEMQQVEFSFLGVNQRQPDRQFVLIRHKHVNTSIMDYCLEHYLPCLPAGGVQHTFQTPPQAWAAHLQQLKAPPADTDITAGHSNLGSSAVAGTVAKAQPGNAASSSAQLMQERQQQQQLADVQSQSARTAEVKPSTAALSHFPTVSPAADTTTAQINTLTGPPVPAPLPKVGKAKIHSSAGDTRPAVSTAEVNIAGVKPEKTKSAEVRVNEVEATEAKATEAKATQAKATDATSAEAKSTEAKPAKAKAKAKTPPQDHVRSSCDGASTRPKSEQGMPNLSNK